MARASSSPSSISQIRDAIGQVVGQFVGQLSALIEQNAVSRARDTILSAFGGESGVGPIVKRGRGRPPGRPAATTLLAIAGATSLRKRRKAPIQLCPVPGCTNRAAPVFGMVCAKHKDLPKMEIRRYREARRAKRDKNKVAGKVGRPRKVGRPARRVPAGAKRGSAAAKRAPAAAPKPVAAAS